MSAADKLMFDWWDNRDMGWAAITRKVNEMTGLDEDTMEIATRYAALRRYLHHKERIIIVRTTPSDPGTHKPGFIFHTTLSDHLLTVFFIGYIPLRSL